jgi:hypothetical protein
MTITRIEKHEGFYKLVWSDGSKLIVGKNDATRIALENNLDL